MPLNRGAAFRKRDLETDRQIGIDHVELQRLHGQTVVVKVCEPAACAGSDSWRAHPPRDPRNACRVVAYELGLEHHLTPRGGRR